MKRLPVRAEPVDEGILIPDLLPGPLPKDAALRVANLARIGPEQHEVFFDLLHWTVALVWMRDQRALGEDVDLRLERVAAAARTLYHEFGKLDPLSQKWVERLWRRTFSYKQRIGDVPATVFQLAHLFSSAAGMSPPRTSGVAAPEHQKGSRDRTRNDVMFLDFVCHLKMVASESGGKLGLDPSTKRGTLLEAVNVLRPHLPQGVVPDKFPFSAFKKMKFEQLVTPSAEIDFYSPEP